MKKNNVSLLLAGMMTVSFAGGAFAETQTEMEAASEESSTESSDYVIEEDPQYNIPTDELLQKFPIKYQTPADSEMSQKIQNRMLNGFNQWNLGFEAWQNWGSVLYSDDSIYNVHGVRMTLKEYQMSMGATLQKIDIQMGSFTNMILVDDWMAIQYDITTNGKAGTTMEFARFKDFGPRGAKVDEGWGGIKSQDYDQLMQIQTDEEKAAQDQFLRNIINTTLPETDSLDEKYPVEYPTTIDGDKAQAMKDAVLQDIDHWNSGYDDWAAFADTQYTADGAFDLNNQSGDLTAFKAGMKQYTDKEDVRKVKVMNILTSADWTAVHLWNVITGADGQKTAADTMAFYHFNNDNKIDQCFVSENL